MVLGGLFLRSRHPAASKRRFSALLVLTLVAGMVGVGNIATQLAVAPQAQAAAGVPVDGTPVFNEDFERYAGNPAAPFTYTTYGQLPGNPTYQASPMWNNAKRCNGVILNQDMSDSAGVESNASNQGYDGRCGPTTDVKSFDFMRMLPQALQQVYPVTGAHPNTAVSSFTECQTTATRNGTCDSLPVGPDLANGSVMFRTSPTQVPTVKDHYYSFGIDTAYMNCYPDPNSANPRYIFSLFTGANGAGMSQIGSALEGCSGTASATNQTQLVTISRNFTYGVPPLPGPKVRLVRVNRMVTDTAYKASGAGFGLQVHNATSAVIGNDGAFDNVRVVDVTPQLDKSFSPSTIAPGESSTVTLTVTNTSDLNAKPDWSVSDKLPAGLVLDSPVGAGGTCSSSSGDPYVVTGVAGSDTFGVSGGDLVKGAVSCTVTFKVKAAAAGTYSNGKDNVTTNLVPPVDPAVLTVVDPRLETSKSLTQIVRNGAALPSMNVSVQPGDRLTYTVSQKNFGVTNGRATVTETVPAGTSYTGTGQGWTCTPGTAAGAKCSQPSVTSAGTPGSPTTKNFSFTVTVASPLPAAQASIVNTVTSDKGTCVDCTVTTPIRGAWTLKKEARVNGALLGPGDTVKPGQTINYTVRATSTSAPDVPNVVLKDDLSKALDDADFVSGSAKLKIGAAAQTSVPNPVGSTLSAGPFTLPGNTTAVLAYDVKVKADAFSRELINVVSGTGGPGTDLTPPAACTSECTTRQVTPNVVQVQKVGEDSQAKVVPMDGSAWAIRSNADGSGTVVANIPAAQANGTPVTGLFRFEDLSAGTYWLEETRSLQGFSLLASRVKFTVASDGKVTLDPGAGTNVKLVSLSGVSTIQVEDQPARALPDAGGSGTTPYLVGGLGLLAAGLLLGGLRTVRRRHI